LERHIDVIALAVAGAKLNIKMPRTYPDQLNFHGGVFMSEAEYLKLRRIGLL